MSVALENDPPASGDWTTDDLDAMPEDGRRRELIDGVLIVSPSPARFHQLVAARLCVALEEGCPEDYDVTQGVEVRVSRRRSFIPDVLVVNAQASTDETHIYQPHDVLLAVEIVSPNSIAMDHVMKPALYAEAGIPLYWCIDTRGEVTVHTHRLKGDADVYAPTGTFTDVIALDQPWEIWLPVAKIAGRRRTRDS